MRKLLLITAMLYSLLIAASDFQPALAQTSTSLSFIFFLHGIGKGGDNSNHNSIGNMNPVTPSRPVNVEIYDSNNTRIKTVSGTMQFNNSTGLFTSTLPVSDLATGAYTIRVYTPKYLRRQLNGIISVTQNQSNFISPAALVVGDSTNDNKLDLLDYNQLTDCFSSLSAPRNCADQNRKFMADLTDDGQVNQFDYNLFIRELSVQGEEIDPTPTAGGGNISPTTSPGPFGAFPGATGFGRNSTGGRGGKVMYVTNTNDSGTGSLRECTKASGSRTCIFKVSGTINLQNDLDITQPYLTIAGQTAPGNGVQVKGGMLKIATHDVIIRYLRVRTGNPNGSEPADTDAISLSGNRDEVKNIIIDHCTLIWGPDIGGLAILTNSHDVTIQDSIIGEGLNESNHPESPHSTSLNVTQLNDTGYPTRVTIYRNLITSSDNRNPQIIQAAEVEVINNVIYNWGAKSAYGNPKSLNLVNNYFVKGPLSKANYFWDLRVDADYPTQNNNAVFETGNVAVGFNGTRSGPGSIYTSSPRFTSSIAFSMTAQDAYNYVVNNVGAIRPARDQVDQRIINNLTSKTMQLPNGSNGNRFVNAADLVWPSYTGGIAPADADNDGMPDTWEQEKFGNTSRGSATNSSSDFDGDGYTDLEEYLNGTDPKAKN